MSVPRSLRRLLDPQDHGSLEDITLHPQLSYLTTQPLQLGVVVLRQARGAVTGVPSALHPVAQRALVDPEVASDLRDRLPGLLDDPNSSLTELPVVLLPYLWHLDPHCRCLHGSGGTSLVEDAVSTASRRSSSVSSALAWWKTSGMTETSSRWF